MAGDRYDAVIIGGGPAGATAAIRCAEIGLRVLVLEAERFPRHHVGESLVNAWSVFEALGVSDEVDATFQHKRGSCRVWGRDTALKFVDFQTYGGSRNYSVQIERGRFDRLMLDRARTVGADVREGHRVTGVLWEAGRAVGVRYTGSHGEDGQARARWVIDASGRSGLIARARGLRRVDPFFPDLSVYAYYEGARRLEGEHAGNLLIEAVPWGWFWFIPLHTGEVSVGLVCDRSTRAALKRGGLANYLGDALAQSRVIADMLAPARVSRGPFATASYGYAATHYAGAGWILAGDAGSFIDPMWATGVANALTDGIHAAAMVKASLGDRIAESALIDYYQREREQRARFTLSLVKQVYRFNALHAEHPFWATRRDATPDPSTGRQVMMRLARDSSVPYFRKVFHGMGIASDLLEPLDRSVDGFERRHQHIAPLVGDPSRWVPRIPAPIRLYDGVGHDLATGLQEGLIIDSGNVTDFVWQPDAVAAIRAIDGHRTARDIIDEIVAAAPLERRFSTSFRLLATLVDVWERGVIEARFN